jgi:hypothetical protein
MATRDELLAAVSQRYRTSSRADKSKIIDEFAASTGYHPKHVMRVLAAGPSGAFCAAAIAAHLRGGRTRGADRALGGFRSRLREAA